MARKAYPRYIPVCACSLPKYRSSWACGMLAIETMLWPIFLSADGLMHHSVVSQLPA